MTSESAASTLLVNYLTKVANGNVRALAKAITLVEDYPEIIVEQHQSGARIIGITGSPGVGKSTTVNSIITYLRSIDKSVAVLAVDPSSPITGGALLGDRIRLTDHFLDPKVFIRSLATRGHLGGLSATTAAAISVTRHGTFDYILVETVGVGQSEVEVMKYVDTVLIVLAPGMGDGIQASKAGLLEIGDIYLVNKSDLDGAKQLASELEKSLNLMGPKKGWTPPILLGAMEKSGGIEELITAINSHHSLHNLRSS
jgi:LAO/AO transport system kinase